jgi:ribosomal-protein-alanine N-acetyltransferase
VTILITTARLRLRRYAPADLAALTRLLGDPGTMRHWPQPLTANASRAWLERALTAYAVPGYGRCAVELHDGTYIGDAGVVRGAVNGRDENDLGYIIDERFWGRGYGLEAAEACVSHARQHGIGRIVANMAADNVASIRVAERLGFALERRFANPRNRGKETLLFVSERAQEHP